MCWFHLEAGYSSSRWRCSHGRQGRVLGVEPPRHDEPVHAGDGARRLLGEREGAAGVHDHDVQFPPLGGGVEVALDGGAPEVERRRADAGGRA